LKKALNLLKKLFNTLPS